MIDRKTQILEVATELVQTRGYSAFSYQNLSDRLGITKASLHHHFASKEKLGIAVAEKYNHDVKAFLQSGDGRRSQRILELSPGTIQVRVGQAQQVFSFRIPPAALASAIEKTRSDRE